MPNRLSQQVLRYSANSLAILAAFSLVLTSISFEAKAGNNGGAAAIGFAAGLVLGGALNAAKAKPQQPPPQQQKTYKKKKSQSKPKSTRKKTYSKQKSTQKPTQAKRKSTSRKTYAAKTPSLSTEQLEVKQVRSALFLLGHLKGDAESTEKDSVYRAAIRAYQTEKRLAATGVLDPTQRQILLGEAEGWRKLVALDSPETPVEGLEGNKRIQVALEVLGYYDGAIDGQIGSGSSRAIGEYQTAYGLTSTGGLSSASEKSGLITAARTMIKNELSGYDAKLAQISAQQLASLTGGATTAAVAAPVAAAAAPSAVAATAAPAAQAALATPSTANSFVGQGYLPKADVKQAALEPEASPFDPIEPVQADATVRRPQDVAVIIGNRNYRGDIPNVAFGHRDADAMRSVLINELGFSPANVIDARDAGQAEMVAIFGSESNNRGKVWRLIDPDGRSNVFVFYSGHGAPDTKSKTPYLMPVDSHPDTIELNGYPLSQMYSNLDSLEVKSVAVFLDACFSGGSAAGMLTTKASPVAVTARMPETAEKKKLTVLAAAEGDQLASWNEKSGFGMFTNYLVDGLKGKADADGDQAITAGELHAFVHSNVRRTARREFGRIQTPVLMGEPNYVVRQKQ